MSALKDFRNRMEWTKSKAAREVGISTDRWTAFEVSGLLPDWMPMWMAANLAGLAPYTGGLIDSAPTKPPVLGSGPVPDGEGGP